MDNFHQLSNKPNYDFKKPKGLKSVFCDFCVKAMKWQISVIFIFVSIEEEQVQPSKNVQLGYEELDDSYDGTSLK